MGKHKNYRSPHVRREAERRAKPGQQRKRQERRERAQPPREQEQC
jgi:hypothetical protein